MSLKEPPHWEECSISILNPFAKALPGFRTSGRRSPFKTAALAVTENLPLLTVDSDFRAVDTPVILPPGE
ncbi:MAG: hypothetical protein ACREWE_14470 [Gammaproteobacteria bacterium]